MIKKFIAVWLATLGMLVITSDAWASVPFELNYSGRFVDLHGAPVSGPVALTVEFFDAESAGNQLGSTFTYSSVSLSDGVFTLTVSINDSEFNTIFGMNNQTWIQVTDTTHNKTYPRQRFFAVPYAFKVPIDSNVLAYDASGRITIKESTSSGVGIVSVLNNSTEKLNSSVLPALSGDVTGAPGANSVTKIQGAAVSAPVSGTDNGKYLQYTAGGFVLAPIAGAAGGTVTNVGVTAPLVATGNTGVAPTISISASTGGSDGYLSSADWIAFNAKQAALPAATSGSSGYLTGSDWIAFNAKQAALGYSPLSRAGDTMSGTLTFSASNGYVGIKAPSSVATSTIFTLPAADGTSGQFLATNGSGSLTWSSQSAAPVISVAGKTGTVTLSTNDVTEGSSLYYTDARVKSALNANGPLTYSSGTFGINQAGGGADGFVSSSDWSAFNGKQSALSAATSGSNGWLSSSDWLAFNSKESSIASGTTSQYFRGDKSWQTLNSAAVAESTNLYFTAARAQGAISVSAPVQYSSGVISMSQSGSGANGYLSSADWGTFNGKQPAGNYLTALTGDISASGPGSVGATLASVATAGTYIKVTIDAKGRVLGGTTLSASDIPALPASAIPEATSGADGYLSSSDWSTFNGKQNALTAATSGAGGYLSSTDWLAFNGKQPALGYSPLNKAGDTMSGALSMGGYDLSAVGNVGLGASKTLALGTYTTDPAGLTAGDKGKTWFNSTTGEVKYWNGSSAIALGAAGSGLANLNGQVGNTQTFANGLAGTAPAFNSASNVHTLNIPMASDSSVTAGLISKSDYDTFNGKQPAGNYLTSLSGDVTATGPGSTATLANVITAGTYTKVTVDAKGRAIAGTTLSAGDIPTLPANIIPQSSASASGYLSSGDWSAFNGKQNTLSSATESRDGYLASSDWSTFNGKQSALSAATSTSSGYLASSDWISFNSKGGVASVTAGTGLSGGTITTNGTIALSTSGVTAGTYTRANVTVDSYGRISSAANSALLVNGDIDSNAAIDQGKIAGLTASLAGKQDTIAAGSSGQYYRWDKSWAPLDTAAVAESGGLYYTDARARAAVGGSGVLAYDSSTGVFGLAQANVSTAGYLSSTDWGVFNGKQANLGFTPVNKAGDTMSGTLSFSASNGYVGIKAPSSVAASTIFTLPASDGTGGQFLSTDGSGTLTWNSQGAAPVSTVAGRTGAITLTTSDVAEGSNLYYTDARVKSALNASGPLTYSSGTFGINQAGGGANGYISSTDWSAFNGKQSALSAATSGSSGWLSSSDWLAFNSKESAIASGTTSQYFRGDKSWQTLNSAAVAESTNLYYTDSRARSAVSGSGVLSYNSATGAFGIDQATGTTHGYLSSADWAAFNAKQGSGSYISTLTSDVTASGSGSVTATVAFVGGSSAASIHTAEGLANAATDAGTASTIVKRDASGNFTAGTITATLSGNATTATTAGNVSGIVALAHGGTGATDAAGARTALGIGALATLSSIDTSLVAENTNLYYTDARARAAISASGTLSYNSTSGAISMAQVDGSHHGYLSSVDWTAFNGKQAALGYIPVNKSGDTMSGNLLMSSQKELRFGDSGANYVGLKAPSSIASSLTFTLPAADGSGGQILSTNGSGTLDWVSLSSAAPVTSVANRTGAITLTTGDVAEGTSLYYSDTRARSAISVSGALSYNSTSGAIGLAQVDASHNGYLSSGDWGAFNGKQSALSVANSGSSGILASSDWIVFNGKQAAGSYLTALTGDVTASGPGSAAATVAYVGSSSAANIHNAELLANAAIDTNSVSTIVKRDASGNFSAGTITATLSGNATSATTAGNVTGIVAVANGGTGSTTLAANSVLLGNGTSAPTTVAPSTSGNVLTSNGTTWSSTALPATSWDSPGNIGSTIPAAGAFTSLSTNAQKAIEIKPYGSGAGTGELRFDALNGTSYIGFKAPGSLAGVQLIWTLPIGDGANGQLLKTDGSGNLSWGAISGDNIQTGTITGANILDGTITDADLAISAGIQQSKISGLSDSFAAKEPTIAASSTDKYWRGDKSWQTLNTGAVAESTNLYFTTARAQAAISATLPVSYSGGVISMAQAGSGANGYLSSSDWSAFNGKQPAGSYITALSGDVSASGPGSVGATLASVATAGTYIKVTIDAKGRTISGTGLSASDIPALSANIIPQAGGSAAGYISSADWNTFNSKQNTLSAASGNTSGYLASADWTTFNTKQAALGFSPVNKAGDTMSGPILMGSQNDLRFGPASGTNYVSLKAPATVSTSVTWTLPAADGTGGQVLSTNGSGTLNWSSTSNGTVTSVSGGGPISVTSGTTTPAISISQAATGANGYLSSTDWNSFNGKMSSLGGLTAAIQTFAIGTTGNSPAFSSATSTHTLNIPMSSVASVTAGLLSNTDWTTFNGKQAAVANATSTSTGLLSSSDWIVFNSKEPALTATTTDKYYRGDKTWQVLNSTAVTEGSNLYYLDTRARSAISTSAPLAYSSATGIVSLPKATSSADGYLSSGDWSTFNTGANQWSASGGNIYRSSGNVGIGTTNPQASLDINNGSSAAMVRLDSNGHIGYVFQNTNATIVVQEDSGGVYMSSGGTSWVSNSDRRLKTGISPQGTSELSRIMSLNPVTFHWKDAKQDATQGLQYGFIAQEVQKVYPEFVTLGGDTKITHKDGSFATIEKTLGVSQTSLISPLVKAVQEIKAEKDAEIAALKVRVKKAEADSKAKDAAIAQLKAFLCGQFPNAPMCQP